MPNGPDSTYRTFDRQVFWRDWWCARGKCQNAAVPGNSNHGLGAAVDSNDHWISDSLPEYGWHKSHSDAPWESWHRKWGGFGKVTRPKPWEVVLKKGIGRDRAVKYLKRLLHRIPEKHDRKHRYWRERRNKSSMYGWRVRRVIKKFQRDHGLVADGVVGPTTWRAMRRAAK